MNEVELIQVYGSDLTTVNAARVSFGKRKVLFDKGDERLVNYLAEHEHTTPFRHSGATFCITCPIFVARQIHKHQVGMSVNEISGRYVELAGGAWYPEYFRSANPNVKQGSLPDPSPFNSTALALYDAAVKKAQQAYEAMLGLGICKEQARAVLPLSTFTSFWMTGTLQAWAHFYTLRVDSHAQREVQEYARQIGDTLIQYFPVSWKALTKPAEE